MPDAIALGPLLIPVLRAATVLALLIAPWWASRRAQADGLDGAWFNSVATNAGWIGLIGARVGFVLANLEAYRPEPLAALYVWQAGYLPWAGVLVGPRRGAWPRAPAARRSRACAR